MTQKVLLQQDRLACGNCVAGGQAQKVRSGRKLTSIPQKLMNAGRLNGNGKILNQLTVWVENLNITLKLRRQAVTDDRSGVEGVGVNGNQRI